MKVQLFLFFALTICSFTNCKRENEAKTSKENYVVISKQDSISKASDKTNKIPKPYISPEMKWYSDLVFIMDNKNKVYIYQTEKVSSNSNTEFYYPYYIGLRPEYLVTVDSQNFVSFLKNNNDIFGIFPNKKEVSNFFYVVSETDTIKNVAFTNLNRALGIEKSKSIYLLRKTTEEENVVLKFKRSQESYDPELINWSTKFYNGYVKPFTKQYEDLEMENRIHVKAKETFREKIRIIYL